MTEHPLWIVPIIVLELNIFLSYYLKNSNGHPPLVCRTGKSLALPAGPPYDFTQVSFWRTNCISSCAMLDRVAGQLERYMDLLSARQKLVASNIANADTP